MSEEKVPEPTLGEKLKDLLKGFGNAPSPEALDALKAKHGDVFLSALNDDEVFLFRALTRAEHRSLNTAIAENKLQADSFEEEVLKVCILWSSVENLHKKAGTIPSLFEQVMQNSNFLSPQLLANLVTKL